MIRAPSAERASLYEDHMMVRYTPEAECPGVSEADVGYTI